MGKKALAAAAVQSERLEAVRLEYQTLRTESSDARVAQQSTLAWSLAAYAALITGGLVFVSSSLKSDAAWSSAVDFRIFSLVFGVALPVFCLAGSLAYLGELARMERVGSYLRALETLLERGGTLPAGPWRWESYLRFGDGKAPKTKKTITTHSPKQWASYVGGALTYAIVLVSTYAIFAFGLRDTHMLSPKKHDAWAQFPIAPGALWTWFIFSAMVIFVACALAGGYVVRAGRRTVRYEEIVFRDR